MKDKKIITLPKSTQIPNHIAMILDGNRRWARAKGLKPWEGHRAGYLALKDIAEASRQLGVHTFTVWAFSTENWERPKEEIMGIMELLRTALAEMERDLHRQKVRMVHLGRKDRLPVDIVDMIHRIESDTRNYANHVFNVALDYGGHDEIIRATNKILQSGVKQIDEKEFAKFLDTGDQPYPYVDLFIRTSGEQRTSGLLPWQMSYAEYYWVLEHLPDMTPDILREAILDYSRRRRRFGGNDAEEHLKFNPKVIADLELKWRHELAMGAGEKFRQYLIRYVKEQYGLSKDLAKTAGYHLASALIHRDHREWQEAKGSLKELYAIVKKNLGLAFEPEVIANFEVNLWKNGDSESGVREFLGEKYRFSEFQAAKSAHLAVLANRETNPAKARSYWEKFYQALKERVA